ncbi:MAG: glutathione S-transferase family protein [Alphaproteobacteria bacterium]|jgi:glutathione S-transferase|nr:glutathione S-transferase family protein [Alphaproteobacteria bacterium]
MTIKIWNFPRGARGVRLFWQCEEMGLAYQAEAVSFPVSDAYAKLNPIGNVPFLQDGEVAINESVAIMFYLAERYGPTPLLPKDDPVALARVLQLTVFSEASLGAFVNTLLMAKFGGATEADKQNWSVRAQDSRVDQFVDYVVKTLGDRPYLVGSSLTLADIAISTSLGVWVGALGRVLPPSLAAYQERLHALPTYQRARDKQQR